MPPLSFFLFFFPSHFPQWFALVAMPDFFPLDSLMDMSICPRSLDMDALSSDGTGNLSRSFSVDSLMDDDGLGMVEDVTGYYEAQKNQIFIGMATLQYQARQVCSLFFLVFFTCVTQGVGPRIVPGSLVKLTSFGAKMGT